MSESKKPVSSNPWHTLRQFTSARIALGRAGISQPTGIQLDFQLAHAKARDAVHTALDAEALRQACALGLPQLTQAPMCLHSAAASRTAYLQRPDLGRRLDGPSRAALQALPAPAEPWDLAIVVADGLSALAIEQNALPLLQVLAGRLAADGWRIAPLCIVSQARVALADEVGELLGARAVVVLIGERPGLSAPDSMGAYLTWQPRVGLTDAGRNCISNIRPAGMGYDAAAHKLHYLLSEARRRQLSGVELKDESAAEESLDSAADHRFLL